VEITFDPYEFIPFSPYGNFIGDSVELNHCYSLMHYIESEKFRGVDEQYRRFILRIADKDDFRIETAAVSQACRREDWQEIRGQMISAGVWMQLIQNQDTLLRPLLDGELVSGIMPIDLALSQVRDRILSREQDPLRRVLVGGCVQFEQKAEIYSMLDSIFRQRRPDELIVSTENGVSRSVAQYAYDKYIPLALVSVEDVEQSVATAMRTASHVFVASKGESTSPFAESCLAVAQEASKVAHRIDLEALCA
jgi:hypothetical protein